MASGQGRAPILVTGGGGQVGCELRRLARAEGTTIVAPARAELDIGDPDAVAAFVGARPWSAVINAAAHTAVDRAESDVVQAWRVNALGPAALAAAAREAGVPIVHLSTDYVFDGAKADPYVEDDPVAPLGVYGASKEGGEQAVRTAAPRHVILRTAWVVSPHGGNFVKTMLRLGAERPLLRVVDDQRGCPTSAADIAQAAMAIAARLIGDPGAPSGTYHFVNRGEASWCEFAREIFAVAAQAGLTVPRVEAIGTADYPTPARRPANSRLSTEKLIRDFAITPRPWRPAVREIVQALIGRGQGTET